MFEKKEFKWNLSCFIFGVLSSLILFYLSLFLNEKFNTLFIPDMYVIYIPLIYGIISQVFFRNLLSDTICPNVYFEKGVSFFFISQVLSKLILPITFTVNLYGFKSLNNDLIAYNFILYISPLLAYLFFSWIYYFIQDLRLKYYTQKYIENLEFIRNMPEEVIEEDKDIDRNEEELTDIEENPKLLNLLEKITKVVSSKVKENIEDNNKK